MTIAIYKTPKLSSPRMKYWWNLSDNSQGWFQEKQQFLFCFRFLVFKCKWHVKTKFSILIM